MSRFHLYRGYVGLAAALLLAVSLISLGSVVALASAVTWIEDPANPVYDPASHRAYYPCVLYDADQFSGHGASSYYKMWYGGYNDPATGVHNEAITYSDDGVTWSAPVEMQGIAATGYHAKVVYVPGGYVVGVTTYYYKMWYWTGSMTYSINDLRTADSTDGVNWDNDQVLTQDAVMPLVTGVSPDWNRGSYGPVSVLYNPSATNTGSDPFNYTFSMYYDGTTGGLEVIGLGYSADGNHWTRYGSNPVLDHGNPGDWDSDYVTNGTVIPDVNGEWHMWYSGSGPSGGGNEGIGYATSPDGINWTRDPNNPQLSKDDGVAWRDVRTYTPSVLYSATGFDGHGGNTLLKMWFSGRTNTPSTNYAVGYAERTNIIPVGPTRRYTTIQSALDAAFPGDIIEVDPGTYNEQLYVNKALTVRSTSGAASTIIDGLDTWPYVVRLRTSDITFEGFTVTNPEYAGGSDASGIIVTESSTISGVRIADCVVHDIGTPTRSPVVYGSVGINLGQCSNVEVDNCEIYNIKHGHTGNTWAHGISIWGNGAGKYATNIYIHDCDIHDVSSPNGRDAGICMQSDMNGVTIQDNTITDTGEYGVDTWDDWGSSYAPILVGGNTISGASAAGVNMVFPGDNTITANDISGCGVGILVGSAAQVTSLRYNSFGGNTTYAIDNQSSNTLDAVWCYWNSPHGPSYGSVTYGDAFSGDLDWRPYLNAPYGGTPPLSPVQVTTTSPLPAGAQGTPYSIDMAATGGSSPYGWFTYEGTLPPGLSLSAGGTLSGTPTASGTFTFTVEAADGQQGDFKQFNLDIGGSPAALNLVKTSNPPGAIARGQVITYTLSLRNDGDTATSGARLSDAIPTYTSYVSHTTTLNGERIPDTGSMTPLASGMAVNSPGATSGVIAPGAEAVVTFMVQVGNDLPLGASIRNTASGEASGIPPLEASCVNGSSAQLPATWYFAEGSTQPGFDEYILLSNMGDGDMAVAIAYITEGGTEKTTQHLVPPHSRRTIYVNAEMPGETGVAAIVTGEDNLICERSMYYQHNGINGGDDVIGANAPSIDLFFAEGFTGTPGSPFEEWLLLLNPNPDASLVTIDYLFSGGETMRREYAVPGRRRVSINVDTEVGEGREVSARIRSELPLVAERAMYFVYNGVWPGGHNGMAATGARNDWYLAEGYTGWEGSQFDEWILVANENGQPAAVTVTYMFPDGSTRVVEHVAAARSRMTVSADAEVGQGQMVSAHVHSDVPVVVERAMYFAYRDAWQGGHNCLGATLPASEFYFAEGYTGNPGSQFQTWVLIQNTSPEAKTAAIDYILYSGDVITQELELPPNSRSTVYANQVLEQESLEFSMRVSSKDGSPTLLAERAMYFSYMGSFGISQGGHDVVGY